MILTAAPFDYLSIVFLLLFIAPIISGFLQGGYRTFFHFIISAACFVLAFLLYRSVAELFISSPTGSSMQTDFIDRIAKISFSVEILPGVPQNFTLGDPIPRVLFESEDFRIAMYDSMHLAQVLRPGIDDWLMNQLPTSMTATVYMHELIGIPLFTFLVRGICFVSISGLGSIVSYLGITIFALIRRALKVRPRKSLFNRLLGVLFGIVTSIFLCWVLGFMINVGLSVDSPLRDTLAAVLRYDDPEAMTLAKWIVTGPFGYEEILANFAFSVTKI